MGMGTLLDTQQQGLWGIKTPGDTAGGGSHGGRGKQIQLLLLATKEEPQAHGEGMGQRRNPGTEQFPKFNLETQTAFRFAYMH